MLPLMIDFSKKKIIIFGGGDVGVRKAAYFSDQADVSVISRSFSSSFDNIRVARTRADISVAGDEELGRLITGAFLVIAATSDPQLNDRIGRICSGQGVLFNNAEGAKGDVIIPSKIEGNHYLIAISTGGESPGVSRFLREHINAMLPNLDGMIELQGRLRETLKQREPDQSRRSRILRDVILDQDVWRAIAISPEAGWKMVEMRYLHE
ncbi:MAG TPA: bifunctional precorrin-2 dehydrogenase/sirohydrochlorin ferrochelatase [Methanoregulaceae archaeon]|nr:bifunctional precorrin-2 dehydrogenase/sirohydrochlorin ferrochelatase [Methanoregulaceae archaeon]